MSNQEKNYELLLSEIMEQSRKEIENIQKQAEEEKKDIINKARTQGEEIKSEMMQEAEQKCNELKRKILSGVHLEIKKINLKNQEELISRFYKEVWNKLNKFRESDDYKKILKDWIVEGALILEKKDLIVTGGEIEKKILNKEFLRDLADQIKNQTGKETTCKISDETLDEGGVIVRDTEDKVNFNNSFSARMQRRQDVMRLLIVEKFIR